MGSVTFVEKKRSLRRFSREKAEEWNSSKSSTCEGIAEGTVRGDSGDTDRDKSSKLLLLKL